MVVLFASERYNISTACMVFLPLFFFLAITFDCLSKSNNVALTDVLRGCGCTDFEPKTFKDNTQSLPECIQVRSKSAGQLWGEKSSLLVCGMLAWNSVTVSNKKLLSRFDQVTSFKFPGTSKGDNYVRTGPATRTKSCRPPGKQRSHLRTSLDG